MGRAPRAGGAPSTETKLTDSTGRCRPRRPFATLMPAALLTSVLVCGSAAALPFAQGAATVTPSTHDTPPPKALAPAVASAMAPGGVRVLVDKVTLDFWWVKALPAAAGAPAVAWTDVAEGTLVGAVQISETFRDIRGRVIKPGVYTLRYGIQPANGDHLGVSPYRDFLLLSPAAADTDIEPKGHDGTIELSRTTIGGSHPAVWSLDPPVAGAEPRAVLKTDLNHDAVVMEVAVSRDGKPAGGLRFGLVLVGRIEA